MLKKANFYKEILKEMYNKFNVQLLPKPAKVFQTKY